VEFDLIHRDRDGIRVDIDTATIASVIITVLQDQALEGVGSPMNFKDPVITFEPIDVLLFVTISEDPDVIVNVDIIFYEDRPQVVLEHDGIIRARKIRLLDCGPQGALDDRACLRITDTIGPADIAIVVSAVHRKRRRYRRDCAHHGHPQNYQSNHHTV
jgi:hypothetical protein